MSESVQPPRGPPTAAEAPEDPEAPVSAPVAANTSSKVEPATKHGTDSGDTDTITNSTNVIPSITATTSATIGNYSSDSTTNSIVTATYLDIPPTPTHHSNTNVHSHRQTNNPSKLPAFRFADLKKKPLVLPTLSQSQSNSNSNGDSNNRPNRIPSSRVSPDPDQQFRHAKSITPPDPPLTTRPGYKDHNNTRVSPEQSPTTFQNSSGALPSSAATTSSESANVKPSISLDSPIPAAVGGNTSVRTNRTDSTETIVASRPRKRLASASGGPDAFDDRAAHPPALKTKRLVTTGGVQSAPPSPNYANAPSRDRREPNLPRPIPRTNSGDRRNSVKRPPISFKPPPSARSSSGSTPSNPSIRHLRTSGSRLSLNFDMKRSSRAYELGDNYGDSSPRDRTLRALEGRQEDYTQRAAQADLDDSGDVFLKIAREDQSRRGVGDDGEYSDDQTAALVRRMSDQRETSSTRGFSDNQAEGAARTLTFRGISQERTPEEGRLKVASQQLQASPLSPRSVSIRDVNAEHGSPTASYNRRRQPSIDSRSAVPARMSSLKLSSLAYGSGRIFNSSPLVPRLDNQKQDFQPGEGAHGQEGTDSTTSTAAPSTMWDELDDLKSRIHRLELTGKLPATSGAAIARASDERPPTANTNATTMSASPKRGPGSVTQTAGDLTITPSLPIQSHPILHSALAKSKQFLSSDVYKALETAATDALNLTAMMGTAGQPGPISSSASSVGGGPVVTDRQLRRKADGICRSLTELCLALSEKAAQVDSQQVAAPAPDKTRLAEPESPTITKFQFTGIPTPGRLSEREVQFTGVPTPNLPSLGRKPSREIRFTGIAAQKQSVQERGSSDKVVQFTGIPTQRQLAQDRGQSERDVQFTGSPRQTQLARDRGLERENSASDRNLTLFTSPKTLSRLEQRRSSVFASSALPSPRYTSLASAAALASATGTTTTTPTEAHTPGRKSSMLLSRARRAQTEEPEEARKSATVLRTRRAGTEEPEEPSQRKTSLFIRSRRNTLDKDDEQPHFRASSRAITEVNGTQTRSRQYISQTALPTPSEGNSLASSALPRRRLAPSAVSSRLVQPSLPTSISTRRYVEKSTPDLAIGSTMTTMRSSLNPTTNKPGEAQFSHLSANKTDGLASKYPAVAPISRIALRSLPPPPLRCAKAGGISYRLQQQQQQQPGAEGPIYRDRPYRYPEPRIGRPRMAADDDYADAAERMDGRAPRSGGRGGGRRGRGGAGRHQDRDVALSRALSLLLRHQAHSAGIKLDAEGYAPLDKVLQWPRIRALNPTVADIKAAVTDSDKQRFALKLRDPETTADDNDSAAWLIRANQGHSIALASEGLHTPVTLEAGNVPDIVVHGTYFAFWDAIVASGGLKRMGRTHVHFGTGLPEGDSGSGSDGTKQEQQQVHDEADEKNAAAPAAGAPGGKVISGMRGDAELLVFVDVERSLRDGAMTWWLSANGVALTQGDADGVVPLKYFKEVRGRRQGVGVLWKDGEKVADLPDGVLKRVPHGKAGSGGGGERGGRGGGRGRGRGKGKGR
ncbi:hypothetical protein DL762_009280 [Monosporascus cannonballus]|uniref:2'-phosphotransferase n=1 Tax=Monosporascus cannonballus TaxID=155416 RepID=A0ABY0GU95_9PEZI|nr:hypothetical protein DL762_009280 [Monosporascus cannonballus]